MHSRALCASLALVAQLLGCASSRMVPVPVLNEKPAFLDNRGFRITGYRQTDGTLHLFRGRVRPSPAGDQLLFTSARTWPRDDGPEAQEFALPRRDVTEVQIETIDRLKTTLVAVSVPVAAMTALLLTYHPRTGGW